MSFQKTQVLFLQYRVFLLQQKPMKFKTSFTVFLKQRSFLTFFLCLGSFKPLHFYLAYYLIYNYKLSSLSTNVTWAPCQNIIIIIIIIIIISYIPWN